MIAKKFQSIDISKKKRQKGIMKHARSGSTFFVLACDSTFEFVIRWLFCRWQMHSEQQAPKSDRFVTQIFDLIYFFETFANFAMPLKNMSTVMLLSLQRYGLKYWICVLCLHKDS